MDIRKRIVGQCARVASDDSLRFDLQTFFIRLILFDVVILHSIRLLEIPFLIDTLGYNNFIYLIKNNILEIHCDALAIGSVGHQESWLRPDKPKLPYGSYAFRPMRIIDRENYILSSLQNLHKAKNTQKKKITKLKSLLAAKVKGYPADIEIQIAEQFFQDIRTNSPIIQKTLLREIDKKFILSGNSTTRLEIKFEEIAKNEFMSHSNIDKLYKMDDQLKHNIIQNTLFSIANMYQRISEMKIYTAITGCNPEDINIFSDKFEFLQDHLSEISQTDRFKIIENLCRFPNIADAFRNRKLDFKKLLKIRETPECYEFRNWLWSIDHISDKEINDYLKSLAAQLGITYNSTIGKVVRWITTTGSGMIPVIGPIVSTSLSALDNFLASTILKQPGALYFINSLYPSIFKK